MNVTLIQEHDAMWIAADSYSTFEINPDTKKFQERSLAVFPIENKIIYCYGKQELINNIMLDYGVSFNRSLEELSNIVAGYFFDWAKHNPNNIQEGIIEVIVCTAEDGHVSSYCISPGAKTFTPTKSVMEKGKRAIWSVGEKSQEMANLAGSLASRGVPKDQIFHTIYQTIKSGGIGGVLTVYMVDTHGSCLFLRQAIPECEIQLFDRMVH
ncbi:MAG: hypothetical protein JWM44_1321 [Bacilli bacterium]|nr:hypothetical protein [Bacilli bacterium]